jgi:hypothetical protein
MSIETRLKTLERATSESTQPEEFITVETVLGELPIPVSTFPALEKIYGDQSSVMPDERF